MKAPEYHKIQSVFKRDMSKADRPFIIGEWTRPEFKALANLNWEWTEKVDGTNIRITWNSKEIHVGGRTDAAQIPAKLYDGIQALELDRRCKEAFPDASDDKSIFLYGEGYGAGIQKGGGDYRPDNGFILFDVFIDKWLESRDVTDIAKKLAIPRVPIHRIGTLESAIHYCQTGFQSELRKSPPEGFVCRPTCNLYDWRGERIITKVKLRDFAK